MAFLRTATAPNAESSQAITGIPIQTSAYGNVIPVVYGTQRVGVNLVWYNDFFGRPVPNDPGAGAGKGGSGGAASGKTGVGAGAKYLYQASLAFAVCQGPIHGFGAVYQSKAETTTAALGFSEFLGTYPQTPWGWLTTAHAPYAFGYNGIAYLAAVSYQLGETAQLPNHSQVVQARLWDAGIASGDADPSLIVADILTNEHYGVGFPDFRIGSLANFQNYIYAAGLFLSPAYVAQTTAASALADICRMANAEVVWNASTLSIVPYGDEALTANGHTYTPPASPQYDLADDDFVVSHSGEDPIRIFRKPDADIINSVKVEALDRSNQYNVAIIEAKDQSRIDAYGLHQDSPRQQHAICDLTIARTSAQLQLQRETIANTYEFTLDARYILLDPMDIVTLTDPVLGLDHQWVRIKTIKENAQDGTFDMVAEEYMAGTGGTASYNFTPGTPFIADYSGAPGDINTPIIFEPDGSLSQGLEIWFAISGGPDWGGCEVWASDDGSTYRYIGQVNGAARMGALSAPLAAYPAVAGGQTIDQTNTLSVDLTESAAELLSGSQASARAYNTLCYVGGEFISYATATLTGLSAYNLTYLVRGSFGTFPNAHTAGAPFCRIDQGLFRFPYTSDRIGSTLHFKFPSFNLYRGGLQSLADVTDYPYTLTGVGATPIRVAFDNLSAELQGMLGFQADGAQLAADLAAQSHDIARFSIQDAVARISTEADTRQAVDSSIANSVTIVSSGLSGEIDARAQAVSGLNSSVNNINGTLVSQANLINGVQSTINNPATGLAALGQAANALTTRVTAIDGVLDPDTGLRHGGSVEVVANSVTSIASRLDNPSTGLQALANARDDLLTRVTAIDGVLDPDTGLRHGGSVEVLSGRVTDITSRINDSNTGLSATATATSTLATRVREVGGVLQADGTYAGGLIQAQSTLLNSVSAKVGSVALDANGNPVKTLQQQVSEEITARTNFDGSMTGYWAVQMTQNADLDPVGRARVVGMRLISSTGANGVQASQLTFEIDKIYFAPPGGAATAVFIPGTVNGTAYFGLRGDMVIDGTLTGNKVAANTIEGIHIKAGVINAGHIGTNTIITQSANIGELVVNNLHIADAAVTAHARSGIVTNPNYGANQPIGTAFTIVHARAGRLVTNRAIGSISIRNTLGTNFNYTITLIVQGVAVFSDTRNLSINEVWSTLMTGSMDMTAAAVGNGIDAHFTVNANTAVIVCSVDLDIYMA